MKYRSKTTIYVTGIFVLMAFPIFVSAGTLKISLKDETSGKFTETKTIENTDIYYLYQNNYISNHDGSMLLFSSDIYSFDSAFNFIHKSTNLPNTSYSILSTDDKYMAVPYHDFGSDAVIQIYNIEKGIVDREFRVKKEDSSYSVIGVYLFDGADKMVFQLGQSLQYTQWKDRSFTNPFKIDATLGYDMVLSAPQGKKIVYQGMKELNHETLSGSFLLVFDGEKWSEAYQLKNSEGKDIYILGISGDGNRIFFHDGQYKENIGYQFYTANLEREKLVNIEPMIFSISGADHIQVSEDGNTIVLNKARQPLVPSDSGAFNTFDLFSYVRNASGQWVQSKINSDKETVSMGYFVMSKNGNRVFWMPETDPSTIDWTKYNTNQ